MFTFLTRHYPPNANINGESVCDVVEYLAQQHGLLSHVVTIDRQADGVGQGRTPAGMIERVRPLYTGQQAALRFIAFLYDGWQLARRGLRHRDTFVVATTSPPLLPMWASWLFGRKVRWAVWAFDLFPEGFAVTHFIHTNNPLYQLAHRITYRGRPDCLIALGERQAAFLQKTYGTTLPTIILPCGVFATLENTVETPDWYNPNFIWLGYCGNVGDPHNPDFIRAAIDGLDVAQQRLVLALYGKHAAELKAYAAGKPGVVLVERVPRPQLRFIDVHLVSLRRSWTHIAVPSKAISAVCMGASILFCGDADSDNWHMLQTAGWFLPETDTPDLQTALATFLHQLTSSAVAEKRAAAVPLQAQLQAQVLAAYEAIAALGK